MAGSSKLTTMQIEEKKVKKIIEDLRKDYTDWYYDEWNSGYKEGWNDALTELEIFLGIKV